MAPEKGGLKFSIVVPQVGGVEALKLSTVAVSLKYSRSSGDEIVRIFEGDILVSLKDQKAGEAKQIQAGTITPGAIKELQVDIGSATATWAASAGSTRSAGLLISQGGQFTLRSKGNVPVPAGRNVNLEIQIGLHCPVVEPVGAVPALLIAGRSYFEKPAVGPTEIDGQNPEWNLLAEESPGLGSFTPTDTSKKACEKILAPDSTPPSCKINSPASGTNVPSEVAIQFQCVDSEPTYGLDQTTLGLSLDGLPVESTQDWTVWVDKRDQGSSVPVAVSGKKDVSLGPGAHEISVVVKDRVGNASPAAKTSFTISPPSAAGPSISNICPLIDVRATGPDSGTPTKILIRADVVSSSAIQEVTLKATGGGAQWTMTSKPPAQYRVILPAKEVAGHTLQITTQDVKGSRSDLLFEPGTSYLYRDVFPNWLLTHWDAAVEKFIIEPPPESGEDTHLLFTEPCFDATETEMFMRNPDIFGLGDLGSFGRTGYG